MTLVDKPLVQYAIDEARAAGIREFIFVTSRGKGALEDYFDEAPQLEQELRKKGKTDLLEVLRNTNMESGAIAYIRQHKALGLGHAVWCARRLIANEPFAVILPDDVIAAHKPCLQQMVEAYEETGGNIVAAMEVPAEQASAYGILDITAQKGRLQPVNAMVEKPAAGTQPSNLAVIGRYILTRRFCKTSTASNLGRAVKFSLPMPSPPISPRSARCLAIISKGSATIAARRRGSCRPPWPLPWRAPICAMNWIHICARWWPKARQLPPSRREQHRPGRAAGPVAPVGAGRAAADRG